MFKKSFEVGNTVRFVEADNVGARGTRKNALYVVDRIDGDMVGIGLGRCNEVFDTRLALVSEGVLPFTTGDKVVVTNSGALYNSYTVAAEAMGLTNWIKWGHDDDAYPLKGEVVTVLSAFKYENYDRVVYAVERENGTQHIIGERGVALYVEVPEYPVFKVGDKVRVKISGYGSVRAQLPGQSEEGSNSFHKDMDQYVGEVFKVFKITRDGYRMQGTFYGWMPQWLELYTATPLEEAQAEVKRLQSVVDKQAEEVLELRGIMSKASDLLAEI